MDEYAAGATTSYERLCHALSARLGDGLEDFRKRENAGASEELSRSLRFTTESLEPYEVALAAYVISGLSLVGMIVLDVIVLATLPLDLMGMVFYVLIPTAAVPLAILSFLGTYPKIQARRLRNRALGRLPEVINYLVMSMRLNPSLDRAIEFASENLDEPLRSAMRRILWDVHMRKHHSIEESFVRFSYEWGDWNEDFKRALYAIRSAEMERTHEGLCRGLDKATDIILTGTRQTMESYTSKLSGPTFVLFSMGILLPMILGSMLPMMSVGGLSITTLQLVLLMDVAFPLITFGYAYHILGNRPGTAPPPRLTDTAEMQRTSVAMALVLGAVLCLLMLPSLRVVLDLGYLPVLWAVGGAISLYAHRTGHGLKRKRDEIKEMEDDLPDALFQLGSRISEGKSLEAALERTSETMRGTAIAGLLHRISRVLQLTRTSLDEALFGRSGMLVDHPSRTIRATMRTVVDVVKKDAVTAGQTIVGISHYLRDMKRVEHEIRTQLSSVMGMMTSTALVFAPVVMGVTSALYYVMASVMEGLEGTEGGGMAFGTGGAMVAYDVFTMILGTYLLLTVLVITYFVSGMKAGGDVVEMKYQVGITLPVSLLIFSVTGLLGGMLVA